MGLFNTDYFHLGLVVTIFSYAFGLGSFPAGFLADRFGPRPFAPPLPLRRGSVRGLHPGIRLARLLCGMDGVCGSLLQHLPPCSEHPHLPRDPGKGKRLRNQRDCRQPGRGRGSGPLCMAGYGRRMEDPSCPFRTCSDSRGHLRPQPETDPDRGRDLSSPCRNGRGRRENPLCSSSRCSWPPPPPSASPTRGS